MVQYGKILFLTGFIYHSCLKQLKHNKAASPDHLGTVNAVVWG